MAGIMELAYWISPKGKVISVSGFHIDTVVKYPNKFGESKDTVRDTYAKYDEPVGSEGEARNEIITRVMHRGFIRIRKYNSRAMQNWSVELYVMSRKKAVHISNWARWMIADKQTNDIYADVKITDLKDFRGTQKSLDHMSKVFTECFNGECGTSIVKGMSVYEVSMNVLGDSVYSLDMEFCNEDVVESMDDWIVYAGRLDINDISEEAQIQIMTRKMSGGC